VPKAIISRTAIIIYIWFCLVSIDVNDFSRLKGYFANRDCPIR
jgi:hypothetical protein